jgi:hypothetical protein
MIEKQQFLTLPKPSARTHFSMGLTSKSDINFFNQKAINYGWDKIQSQPQYQTDIRQQSGFTTF